MGKTCWPRGGFSVCWWSTIYIDDGCFIVGTLMPHVHDVWTNAWSNALPGMGALVRGCSSPKRASCLRSSPRTWARHLARGPDTSHAGPMICAWASPPTCMSRGLRAYQGVNAHIQRFACELHATPGTIMPNTHRLSRNNPISTFSPKRSAMWAPLQPESRPHRREPRSHRHKMGGFAPLGARHAGDTPKGGSKCCKTPTITAGVRLPHGCKAPH